MYKSGKLFISREVVIVDKKKITLDEYGCKTDADLVKMFMVLNDVQSGLPKVSLNRIEIVFERARYNQV